MAPGKTAQKKKPVQKNIKLDKVKKPKLNKASIEKILPKKVSVEKIVPKKGSVEKLLSKKGSVEKILPKMESKKSKKELLKAAVNDPSIAVKTKKVKLIMPSKYITESIVDSCLAALEQLAACSKNKNAIFEDETQIFAEINCLKIQTTKGNIKLVLPHSTAASTGEICLITPDLKKGRKIDHEPTVDHWEEMLRKANVTSVKTVMPMRQLRVEYDQFELKRRLLTQHDFIMVDTRVLNHVSHILGKMFFKKHNMLIPVRLDEKDIKKSIETGLRTTMLRLSEGPTSVIVVGHTGMPRQKLKENLLALVKQLGERYPGGEPNIRSIALKLPLSLALPLYVTLRSSNTITPPKIIKKKPKNFAMIEDELSTRPNSKVRVAPDGTVRVIKQDPEISDNEATENEDESENEIGDENESDKEE